MVVSQLKALLFCLVCMLAICSPSFAVIPPLLNPASPVGGSGIDWNIGGAYWRLRYDFPAFETTAGSGTFTATGGQNFVATDTGTWRADVVIKQVPQAGAPTTAPAIFEIIPASGGQADTLRIEMLCDDDVTRTGSAWLNQGSVYGYTDFFQYSYTIYSTDGDVKWGGTILWERTFPTTSSSTQPSTTRPSYGEEMDGFLRGAVIEAQVEASTQPWEGYGVHDIPDPDAQGWFAREDFVTNCNDFWSNTFGSAENKSEASSMFADFLGTGPINSSVLPGQDILHAVGDGVVLAREFLMDKMQFLRVLVGGFFVFSIFRWLAGRVMWVIGAPRADADEMTVPPIIGQVG